MPSPVPDVLAQRGREETQRTQLRQARTEKWRVLIEKSVGATEMKEKSEKKKPDLARLKAFKARGQ